VKALIRNYYTPPVGGANGVGLTQLTSINLVERAQDLGGAHLPRYQMRVGFEYLNSLIGRLGWPAGAAAYNAGPGNWRSVIGTYGADMQKLEREWAVRLRSRDESEGDRIRLRTGLGKDGNPAVGYIREHPTNYEWRPDVRRVARRLVNDPRFKGKIWVCTYFRHPPGRPQDPGKWRDTTSLDVWGFGGRGDPLPVDVGREVFNTLFNDPDPPDIWWTIYRGQMWTRGIGWGASPPGPPDSDPQHLRHIHVTFLDE
jgi:hypothetical protein